MTARTAIVSTIREPGPSYLSWLRYHLAIGFDHVYLFLDDPADPCRDLVRPFEQVTVIPCDDALRAKYATLANYPALARHSATDPSARQTLHMELAAKMALNAGYTWLLHIDADELFFTPDMDAAAHFAKLAQSDSLQTVYLNHEALPETVEVGDGFREIRHFKRNPRLIPPQLEAEIAQAWLSQRGQYFVAYDNGKAAVRLQPGLTARGVHRFATRSGPLPTRPATDAWLLHYPTCGLTAFRRKYEMRGRFADTKPDGTPVAIDFHRLCRDTFASGDEAAFRRLYETQVMMADAEERRRQLALGLVLHIPEPADLLQQRFP